jgi:hypothetical protein
MPWTFAHPAAVIPLRRFCPGRLNFAALVIGALTPDLGYHVHLFGVAAYAHTFPGSIFVCIPAGLTGLACFYLLRKPLCHLLPEPHRSSLMPLTASPAPLHIGHVFVATASVALGAWSHLAWDSFTHRGGWIVNQYPVLKEPALTIGGVHLPMYDVLQHLSTLIGVAALAVTYYFWLRRRGMASIFSFTREDGWRYACLIGLLLVSLVVALALAADAAAAFNGYLAIRVFIFWSAVYGVASFALLLLMAAVLSYAMRREV